MPMVFGSHFWTPGLTPFSTRRGTRRGHPGTRMGQFGTCVGQSGSRMGLPGSRVGLPGTRVGLPGSRMGRQGQETCSTRATSRYEPPRQTFSGPRPKVEKISFSGGDVRAPFAEARLLHALKRERQRDTTRLRLTWESLDSQPASLRLNSPKFCGRGKRAGLGSAAAVLPRNGSPTEALDPSFHARALISSPKP